MSSCGGCAQTRCCTDGASRREAGERWPPPCCSQATGTFLRLPGRTQPRLLEVGRMAETVKDSAGATPGLASWLELSAEALRDNVALFRALEGASGPARSLGCVLKGNAYGHGFT